MARHRLGWLGGVLGALLLVPVVAPRLAGDEPRPERAWKYDEVLCLLKKRPDPYLRHLALETARREKRLERALEGELGQVLRGDRFTMRGRLNLFDTFSGALAVQESLQLDVQMGESGLEESEFGPAEQLRLLGQPNDPRPERRPVESLKKVPLSSLEGPTIKSHPWEEMLAGRKPEVSALSRCVPGDFYLVEFKSAAKFLKVLEEANAWSENLFAQFWGQAGSQDAEVRIKRQLGIEGIPAVLIDALGLEAIALTGSDLYLADGSDVTLLIQGQNVVKLRAWAEKEIGPAGGRGAAVTRTDGTYLDVRYTEIKSGSGDLHAYVADPRPDLHVRSNSLHTLRRVLEAIVGKRGDGQPAARLGATTEFAYMRTLMPLGAPEEDGFIYFSDSFIRRLVGPEVRLKQQRRLRAFIHLKMIEYGALMFRSERGRPPKSLAELAGAGCTPGVMGTGSWACPAGGTYALAADGMSAVSSVYGMPGRLRPLIELDLTEVYENEADAYRRFLDGYNNYWSTYFDPIGIRVQVTPKQYRLETIILPLLVVPIYTQMAEILGGKPKDLTNLPSPARTIQTIALAIHKEPILKALRPALDLAKGDTPPDVEMQQLTSARTLRELLVALHNYQSDYNRLPPRGILSNEQKPLLSWRVALLPYVGHAQLYREFKLDEPWDSEHNQKLIAKMPTIYHGPTATLNEQGKTRFVVPVGKDTVFPPDGHKLTIEDLGNADGLSGTVAIVEAADAAAVTWTKPDDLSWDDRKLLSGVTAPERFEFLAVFFDGTVRRIPIKIDEETLGTLVTMRDGAPVPLEQYPAAVIPFSDQRRRFPWDFMEGNPKLLYRTLDEGLGDSLSWHVLDAAHPIGAELSNLASTSMGGRGGPGLFGMDSLPVALLFQSLTNPACLVVPVKNAQVVDEFLAEVDRGFAEGGHNVDSFFKIEQYQLPIGKHTARVAAIKVIGLTVRICWCRLDDVLVITNQLETLTDLAEARLKAPPAAGPGIACHALFRIRPENWHAVLPGYRLGWAESHGQACANNQMRLALVARALPELVSQDGSATPALLARVHQVYGLRPFCPDSGRYRIQAGGKGCDCEHHGSAAESLKMLGAPAAESATARTLRGFGGLTAYLTFTGEGLQAVVVVDRK